MTCLLKTVMVYGLFLNLVFGEIPIIPNKDLDSDLDGLSDSFELGLGRYSVIRGDALSWQQAKLDAESRGGHLATITSEAEWQAVLQLLKPELATIDRLWLGASDLSEEGSWKWITGESWDYSRWSSLAKEPNGEKEENYLDLLPARSGFGWNDESYKIRSSTYLLEVGNFTSPKNSDSDSDGLSDGAEYLYKTDPAVADSDSDGISDGDEVAYGSDPTKLDSFATILALKVQQDKSVTITLKTSGNQIWLVEASTDLAKWESLGIIASSGGKGALLDTKPSAVAKFYRVRGLFD